MTWRILKYWLCSKKKKKIHYSFDWNWFLLWLLGSVKGSRIRHGVDLYSLPWLKNFPMAGSRFPKGRQLNDLAQLSGFSALGLSWLRGSRYLVVLNLEHRKEPDVWDYHTEKALTHGGFCPTHHFSDNWLYCVDTEQRNLGFHFPLPRKSVLASESMARLMLGTKRIGHVCWPVLNLPPSLRSRPGPHA